MLTERGGLREEIQRRMFMSDQIRSGQQQYLHLQHEKQREGDGRREEAGKDQGEALGMRLLGIKSTGEYHHQQR